LLPREIGIADVTTERGFSIQHTAEGSSFISQPIMKNNQTGLTAFAVPEKCTGRRKVHKNVAVKAVSFFNLLTCRSVAGKG
jgi:hypothetical protein